jgi:hypothetical protein
MSINSREDVNKYYQILNELVDEYTENNKIRPSNLKRYLQPGSERFNRFLEKNKMKDVKRADVILKDILDDREAMEKDGVITFESFKIFESEEFKIHSMKECLYKGIEKSTQKMEKVLADHFDTNLGHIDSVDSDKHIFKISDWEKQDCNVIIYSKEEMNVIKYNMFDHLYDEISKSKFEIVTGVSIELSRLIDRDIFESKLSDIFTEEKLIKTITDCLGGDYKFEKEVSDYFIWIS